MGLLPITPHAGSGPGRLFKVVREAASHYYCPEEFVFSIAPCDECVRHHCASCCGTCTQHSHHSANPARELEHRSQQDFKQRHVVSNI